MQSIRHIIIPDSGADLLRRELALGFAACGRSVNLLDPARLDGPPLPFSSPQSRAAPQVIQSAQAQFPQAHQAPRPRDARERHEAKQARETKQEKEALHALEEARGSEPALFFSVNFQGLRPLRQRLDLLKRAGLRAAVWLVDNPWNILAGLGDPLWKSLPLFVTDAAFLAPLRAHGAERVCHLPLAACFEFFSPDEARDKKFPPPAKPAPLCFAGRAAFPGKERFFAGQSLPERIRHSIPGLLAAGRRPDLFWWERELGLTGASFWPGKKARGPAFGAEESNLAWRTLCLKEAARAGSLLAGNPLDAPEAPGGADVPGLDLYGGEDWRDSLPERTRLLPPVDYYARLPGIYAAARYSLCLTSLQLPQGLNQRHFDVWAAGGFALSDATPGLAIFPEELVRPVRFGKAEDLPALVEKLEKTPGRSALQEQWRGCLQSGHTYAHRAAAVLEALEMEREAR